MCLTCSLPSTVQGQVPCLLSKQITGPNFTPVEHEHGCHLSLKGYFFPWEGNLSVVKAHSRAWPQLLEKVSCKASLVRATVAGACQGVASGRQWGEGGLATTCFPTGNHSEVMCGPGGSVGGAGRAEWDALGVGAECSCAFICCRDSRTQEPEPRPSLQRRAKPSFLPLQGLQGL